MISPTFPDHGSLSELLQRTVGSLRKRIQSLFQGLASRIQNLLRFGILSVAVRVQLVSASADHGGREHLRCSNKELCRKVRSYWRREAQLTGRRF